MHDLYVHIPVRARGYSVLCLLSFRSLPVVNITVSIDNIPDISVDIPK